MEALTKREKMTLLGASIGCTEVSPEARAQAFRETTAALLPEFAHLLKCDGEPNRVPHDCLENLNRDLICGICGARYDKGEGIHLVGSR